MEKFGAEVGVKDFFCATLKSSFLSAKAKQVSELEEGDTHTHTHVHILQLCKCAVARRVCIVHFGVKWRRRRRWSGVKNEIRDYYCEFVESRGSRSVCCASVGVCVFVRKTGFGFRFVNFVQMWREQVEGVWC